MYEVSNHGRVKSLRFNKILKPWKSTQGYDWIALQHGHKAKIAIHRLVACHFIENPNSYPMVNHIDNNISNNRVDNLEWCTQKMNIGHSVKQNRHCHGERNGKAKLTKRDVIDITRLSNLGVSQGQIASMYNVHQCTIHRIIRNKNWKLINA